MKIPTRYFYLVNPLKAKSSMYYIKHILNQDLIIAGIWKGDKILFTLKFKEFYRRKLSKNNMKHDFMIDQILLKKKINKCLCHMSRRDKPKFSSETRLQLMVTYVI